MNIILWITTGIFGIWAAVATIIISKQLQREEHLIDITNKTVGDFETITRLIEDSENIFENSKLQEAFAHDDEVGRYFTNLKDMQDILYRYIGGEDEQVNR